jgi:hypothetical protein
MKGFISLVISLLCKRSPLLDWALDTQKIKVRTSSSMNSCNVLFHIKSSILDPCLKFLLHVCLFHWNTSLEMIGKYGYHREVEIGRIVQTRILGQGLTKTVITLSS